MDERPAIWVGHVVLHVTDVARAADFWMATGVREVTRNEHIAVLEMAGPTMSWSLGTTVCLTNGWNVLPASWSR